jgi:hypothetical protein
MTDDTNEYLKELDKQHNPSSVEDGFSSYPDAKYQTRLDKLYFSKTKPKTDEATGQPKPIKQMCVFDFEVIAGEYAHRKIMKFAQMDSVEKLDFLTRDLRRVGITSFMWSNVQEKFPTALDKLFELELKTKNGFQSVYIQKELKSDAIMTSDALKPKEDVPF